MVFHIPSFYIIHTLLLMLSFCNVSPLECLIIRRMQIFCHTLIVLENISSRLNIQILSVRGKNMFCIRMWGRRLGGGAELLYIPFVYRPALSVTQGRITSIYIRGEGEDRVSLFCCVCDVYTTEIPMQTC